MGITVSARTSSACKGCEYIHTDPTVGWCYMFKRPPFMLPCGHHSKFKIAFNPAKDIFFK